MLKIKCFLLTERSLVVEMTCKAFKEHCGLEHGVSLFHFITTEFCLFVCISAKDKFHKILV